MTRALPDRLRHALPPGLKSKMASTLPRRLLDWIDDQSGGVVIVAYPKCGRTWLRLMLGHVLGQWFELSGVDPFDLDTMAERDRRVPRIHITSDGTAQRRAKAPAELDESKRRYRNKKVILLVRDPRDVVVSWFFQMTKRARDAELFFGDDGVPDDLSAFLRRERGSLQTIVAFYNGWSDQSDVPRDSICLVTYEALRADTAKELSRVLEFIGLGNVPEHHVRQAVEFAGFDRMKDLEASGSFGSRALRPGDASDPESFKVRRGVVGGYVDYLSEEDIQYMEDYIRRHLRSSYGYG